MAVCPKCKRKLKPTDWGQICPGCGVNLMFYGFEDRFYTDAKYAEMGFAKVRVWLMKVKTALIGGKLQIARLSLMLLPVVALLIPLGSLTVSLPLYSKNISIGGIGIYTAFTDGTFSALGGLKDALIVGDTVSRLQTEFFALIGIAAFAVLIFLCEILCFISIKKMSVILCILSMLGIADTVFLMIYFRGIANAASKTGSLIEASNGFGGYALLAAFFTLFVLNAIIVKKGLYIEYKEGDLYRVEVARKLKRGEITLDDIPQPIYETEQEREEREKSILEQSMQGGGEQ